MSRRPDSEPRPFAASVAGLAMIAALSGTGCAGMGLSDATKVDFDHKPLTQASYKIYDCYGGFSVMIPVFVAPGGGAQANPLNWDPLTHKATSSGTNGAEALTFSLVQREGKYHLVEEDHLFTTLYSNGWEGDEGHAFYTKGMGKAWLFVIPKDPKTDGRRFIFEGASLGERNAEGKLRPGKDDRASQVCLMRRVGGGPSSAPVAAATSQ